MTSLFVANNVAISGAIAADVPSQVDTLIEILKKNPTSFENDWKVITLWIGGNDLCRFCKGNAENVPENYAGYVFQTLQKIVTSIPRVYVNLVNIIDVTKLASIDSGSCGFLRSQTCGCVAQSEAVTASVQAAALEYQELLAQVATRPELHGDTFTVELQPFMVNAPIPLNSNGQPDTSYLAPDCFHFSTKV
jgi:phospholipase B1, membrane-associated